MIWEQKSITHHLVMELCLHDWREDNPWWFSKLLGWFREGAWFSLLLANYKHLTGVFRIFAVGCQQCVGWPQVLGYFTVGSDNDWNVLRVTSLSETSIHTMDINQAYVDKIFTHQYKVNDNNVPINLNEFNFIFNLYHFWLIFSINLIISNLFIIVSQPFLALWWCYIF